MPNSILVLPELYKRIRQAKKGERVTGTIHPHTKIPGPCEVFSPGARPIKCRVGFANGKDSRNGSKSHVVSVVFTR